MHDALRRVMLVKVVVTLKERHAGKAARATMESSSVGLESVGGRVSLRHCSDLLEDFLETISRMESEYLRATLGGRSAQGSHSE